MSFNRIAPLLSDDAEVSAKSTFEGFTVNPFGPSLSTWQIQIYQAAFAKAQHDFEKEENAWGEWSI